ncbi:MAG: TetR/AcrR family transcriptional regulator [Oscillospiraceae bacterium]|nr:TetR/AcrR family transcriptional regulator [Oscillospiraceae bacterium]
MANFTKPAIKEAFIRLLNERPLKQITVRDIVEECGINRNSFYYHFSDIPTLLEEIIMEEARRIIAQYPSIDSIETCLLAVIEFAYANKRAIFHIYNSANRAIYEQYLWQVCDEIVTAYADTLAGDEPIPANDRELIIRYYKCVCFGLTSEWLRTGMQSDIKQDLHRICELKKGMAEEMIARSRADSKA